MSTLRLSFYEDLNDLRANTVQILAEHEGISRTFTVSRTALEQSGIGVNGVIEGLVWDLNWPVEMEIWDDDTGKAIPYPSLNDVENIKFLGAD